MPRIALTSKGLSWAQPVQQQDAANSLDDPSPGNYVESPDPPAVETAYANYGVPSLAAPVDGLIDASSSSSTQGYDIWKGPPVIASNLADSSPVAFSVYLLVLGMVFYALNVWITVFGRGMAHFNPALAMANWIQLPMPQLVLFATVLTLLLKWAIDTARYVWQKEDDISSSLSSLV